MPKSHRRHLDPVMVEGKSALGMEIDEEHEVLEEQLVLEYCNEHLHRNPVEVISDIDGYVWCPAQDCYVTDTVQDARKRIVHCPGCGGKSWVDYSPDEGFVNCGRCYNGLVTAKEADEIIDQLIEDNREANQRLGGDFLVTDKADFYDPSWVDGLE